MVGNSSDLSRGRSISVVRELPKLEGGVRFPAPAPIKHCIIPVRICLSLALSLSALLLFSCIPIQPSPQSKNESTKEIHHFVLCWLKDPGNLEHRKQIIEATHSFRKIPAVIEASAGTAVPSDRSIVDDSFDVGILVVVKDEKSLSSYLEHPQHQKVKKETLLPLVKKILVYDIEN